MTTHPLRGRALTPREHQILELVSRGYTNSRIATRVRLSEDTVKTHLRRIYEALGASDRAHAVAIAMRQGRMT